MAQSFVRSCRNLKANSNIVSLTLPPKMMALADTKKAYNSAMVDGEERTYRPDITLFVNDSIANQISTALADGKTLSLEVEDKEVEILQSAKGSYFVKGETIISDPKHLRFTVSSSVSAEFEEANAAVDQDIPFD